jgi:hypothetical protein
MIESTLHYGEVTTFRILLKQDQNRLQSSLTQSARQSDAKRSSQKNHSGNPSFGKRVYRFRKPTGL